MRQAGDSHAELGWLRLTLFKTARLFQRDHLRLGQHQALLGALGFQRLEPLGHGLQVVALPHAAHAGGRYGQPTFPQFVGDANLPEGRLFDGKGDDGVLNLLRLLRRRVSAKVGEKTAP